MRIGIIRRSHENYQRRRASSTVNPDYNGSPRTSIPGPFRRASSAVSDGLVDEPLYHGRPGSLAGFRSRQDSLEMVRSNSQDGGHNGYVPTRSDSVNQWQRGESTDTQPDDLCNGKVLSVLGVIVVILLLTLAFAFAVRFIYR